MVVGPFRQQKVGHRCTLLRVILQPDPSLSAPPQLIILCLPEEDGDHRLLADAQSAIHTYFCRSIMSHLFSFIYCLRVCLPVSGPPICAPRFCPSSDHLFHVVYVCLCSFLSMEASADCTAGGGIDWNPFRSAQCSAS